MSWTAVSLIVLKTGKDPFPVLFNGTKQTKNKSVSALLGEKKQTIMIMFFNEKASC